MKRKRETENASRVRAFALESAPERGDRKNRITAFLVDGLFLWLYLAGLWAWLASALELPAALGLCLPALGAVALAMGLCGLGRKRARRLKLLAWGAALVLFALIFREIWENGLHLVTNYAVDALGRRFPYLLPAYAVTLGETMQGAALHTALIWLGALAALPGFYLVRSCNRLLLGLQTASLFLLWMVTGVGPEPVWAMAASLCFLAVWIRSHGERTPAGRQRLALPEAFALAAVAAAVLAAAGGFLADRLSLGEFPFFSDVKEDLACTINEARYGGGGEVLPEGDFSGLGSLETQGEAVLEITMSRPESYYLRGFTGGSYTGTGWTNTASLLLWENRDLFYWLHQEGFYGQECLGDAAVALSDEAASEEKNVVQVKNLSGSSKYCYVPYELQSGEGSLMRNELDGQKIGDSGLLASGLRGSREYSYEALSNQITNYPSYDAALLKEDSLTEAGRAYQNLEGYYNEFVYSAYLDLPVQLKSVFNELLGPAETGEGEAHADYAEAKQNILYLLTSDYTDTDELESAWNGSDFVYDFLRGTKEGYSVHFASAAAMMFRYYGIPARYVEGYLVTPEDAAAMTAGEPDVLDDTHAHAWVEYYQDGVGWLPFETTPSYLNVMDKADEYQDISGLDGLGSEEQNQEEEEEKEEEEQEEENFQIDWMLILTVALFIGACLLVLVMLGFLIWLLLQRRKSRKAKRLFTSSDKREAVCALYAYTMNLLSVAGLRIRNISLFRYERNIREMFDGETAEEYRAVVAIRQEAVYSGNEITEEQRDIVERFKDKIWRRVFAGGGFFQRMQLKYIYFL